MAQVWLSNVLICPSPLSQLTILIPFSLARLRPLPHTRSREVPEVQRGAAHVCMVRLAISGSPPPSYKVFS